MRNVIKGLFGLSFSMVGSIQTRAILYFNQTNTAKIILYLLPVSAIVTFFPKKQLKSSSVQFSKLDMYLHVPLICLITGFYDGFFGPGTGTFLIFEFYIFLGLHLLNASAMQRCLIFHPQFRVDPNLKKGPQGIFSGFLNADS